jgi:hypothetical protein
VQVSCYCFVEKGKKEATHFNRINLGCNYDSGVSDSLNKAMS